MPASAEIFGSAIILLGNFNPPIFTPDWLERNKLIGSEDADGARKGESLIVSRQASRCETEWFVLQVLEEQFSLTSKGPLAPTLKDLAIGILTLVPHTPVRALGINFMAHYKLETASEYHKIGDVLAPKDMWRKLFSDENQSIGMADVTVVIDPCKRGETPKSRDRKRITVQPSGKVPSGVFFSYNDHHEIKSEELEKITATESAAKFIEEHWQHDWDDAVRVFEGVMDNALKS